MKRSINCIKKIRALITDDVFIKYTFRFFIIMLIIYLYMIYAGMAQAPEFAYAEF